MLQENRRTNLEAREFAIFLQLETHSSSLKDPRTVIKHSCKGSERPWRPRSKSSQTRISAICSTCEVEKIGFLHLKQGSNREGRSDQNVWNRVSNYSADQMGAATPRYLWCNKRITELVLQRQENVFAICKREFCDTNLIWQQAATNLSQALIFWGGPWDSESSNQKLVDFSRRLSIIKPKEKLTDNKRTGSNRKPTRFS